MMIRATPSAHGHAAGSAHCGIGARDARRVLFRHKRKMIADFSTTLALVFLCGIVYPCANVSDARLHVRLGTLASMQVDERIPSVPARAFSILAKESTLVSPDYG
jgi:hypothetical protein